MSLRQQALDLAILGRLLSGPSHGYEIRQHVNRIFGYLHSVSFGSLYPALRRLANAGWICDCAMGSGMLAGSRSKRVYHLTSAGQDELATQLAQIDQAALADEDFGVRFALFEVTDPRDRLRLLRGRREHASERLSRVDQGLASGLGSYLRELVRFTHDSLVREIEWLDRVIAAEENAPINNRSGEMVSSSAPIKENA